jgi:Protein of unknown function (DUF3775)
MQLSQVLEQVIQLAGASRDYWAAELPKRHPTYPIVPAGEDSGPAPREEAQLQSLLEKLPEDLIYQLVLIMYLGRGDFSVHELEGNFKYLKDTFAKPEWAISQMLSKAPLADYLADGLAELQKHGLDVDALLSQPSKSPVAASK